MAAYAGIEGEARWVDLARQAAARLPAQEGTLHRPAAAAALRQALERARTLRAADKPREAAEILDALDALYRDDPDAAEIREMIRKERGP